MILADTSVWVDHFRSDNKELSRLLRAQSVAMHPFVLGELALGLLGQRARTLALLEDLPMVKVARNEEVRAVIEARGLFGKGIGWVDAHLIASVLISPGTRLWTRDKRLHGVAEAIAIQSLL